METANIAKGVIGGTLGTPWRGSDSATRVEEEQRHGETSEHIVKLPVYASRI